MPKNKTDLFASVRSMLERHNESAVTDPGASGELIRFNPRHEGASGYRECFHIREGLVALLSDVAHSDDHSEAYVGDGALKLHFRIRGESGLALDGDRATEIVKPLACGLLVQPAGMTKREDFTAVTEEKSLTLFCARGFLEQLTADGQVDLPKPVMQMTREQGFDYFSMGFPMPPGILTATRRLFEVQAPSPFRELQVQAGTLDLLCQMLQYVSSVAGSAPKAQPRKHDLERVVAICNLLDENLSHAPTISELARTVGWNDTQLTQTFRSIMGETVYEYRHRAAMDAAIELLQNSDTPITQIAFEVGYQYPSNFSTAFRKEFGMTPAAVRKQGSSAA